MELFFDKKEEKMSKSVVPIILQSMRHEQDLFKWNPEFDLNVVNFDQFNRPYIRQRGNDDHETSFVQVLDDSGKLVKYGFVKAIKESFSDFTKTLLGAGSQMARIVFDKDNHAYTLVRIACGLGTKEVQIGLLLYSRDQCRTWQVYKLPINGVATMEYFTGHNQINGPPMIAVFEKTKVKVAKWATIHKLYVVVVKKTKTGLEFEQIIKVTEKSFGLSAHSGGASVLASLDSKTYVIWTEVTNNPSHLGSPTFVATFDHSSKRLINKSFVGCTSKPKNDMHNTPGICLDSRGFLNVMLGAHAGSFFYGRSQISNSVERGWTLLHETYSSVGQTYIALVCDQVDNLHLVFRDHRYGKRDFHASHFHYCALCYQRMLKDGYWEVSRLLVVPPLPDYSIYYHQLSIDRLGRLFLSYNYYSESEPYKSWIEKNGRYNKKFRAMLFSGDGGMTWQMATTRIFLDGFVKT